jgi:type III secretory pathway component EscU
MIKTNTKVISIKKIRPQKNRSKPYWNFWKVVFAGWLIRYPKTYLKLIGLSIGFLLVMIYNATK